MNVDGADVRNRSTSLGSIKTQVNIWRSLIKDEPHHKGDVISEIFDEYALRMEMPVFQPHTYSPQPELCHALMESVLRDIFMKYSILKDPEKANASLGVSRLFGFSKSLKKDIDGLFSEGFDFNWKMSQFVHWYELEKKVGFIAYETLADGFCPNILTHCYELPLLRYRLVQQLNAQFLEAHGYAAIKVLDRNCPEFREEIYRHATVHSHKNGLIDDEVSKDQTVPDSPSTTPLGLRKRLTSSVRSRALSAFLILRKASLTEESSPSLTSEDREKELPVQMIKPLLEALNNSRTNIKLSPRNLESLFSYFLNYSISNIGYENKEIFDFLSRLAQIVFKLSLTEHSFEISMNQLAQCLRQIVLKQERNSQIEQKNDIWTQFFDRKLKDEELYGLMTDLNMACVSNYRQIIPEKLNDKICNFIDFEVNTSEIEETSSLIVLFNQLSMRVMHSIITTNDTMIAIGITQQWIKLAHLALQPPIINLHIAYAILAGLSNSAVDRLDFIHNKLSKEAKKSLKELRDIFNVESNFKSYRTFIDQSHYPVIPYFGMITRDFIFATEVEPSQEQSSIVLRMINDFKKTISLLSTIVLIKQYKTDGVYNLLESVEYSLIISQPPEFTDFEGKKRQWKKGEWEELSDDEKLFYLSKHNWPAGH
jgi:hypothetical protein